MPARLMPQPLTVLLLASIARFWIVTWPACITVITASKGRPPRSTRGAGWISTRLTPLNVNALEREGFGDNQLLGIEARTHYDLTHSFKFNHYTPLPVGTGHRISSTSPLLKHIIDGWALSGFGVIQTGAPVSVLSARGTLNRVGLSAQNTVDTSATVSQLHQDTGLFMTGSGPYWIDPAHIGSDGRGVAPDGAAPFSGQVFFNPQPGTQGS